MARDIGSDLALHIDSDMYGDPDSALRALVDTANLTAEDRAAICTRAATLVTAMRTQAAPGLMEVFCPNTGCPRMRASR